MKDNNQRKFHTNIGNRLKNTSLLINSNSNLLANIIMKLVIVFAALVAIATVVDGLYVGEKPEDWPTQDPKQTCNGWGDCQYGERCQSISYHVGSYCVPDSCQKNSDCPDLQDPAPFYRDWFSLTSVGCNKGTCAWSSKGGPLGDRNIFSKSEGE